MIEDIESKEDLIKKSGAWYEYEGEKFAQGREAAKQYLRNNPKVLDEIARETRAAVEKAE